VLMRALRDFNIPKIVTDDVPIFMGLIGDLFPALDVPRKRDIDFEKMVKQAALDLQLQSEDNFILKVSLCFYYGITNHFLFLTRHWTKNCGQPHTSHYLQVKFLGVRNISRACAWSGYADKDKIPLLP